MVTMYTLFSLQAGSFSFITWTQSGHHVYFIFFAGRVIQFYNLDSDFSSGHHVYGFLDRFHSWLWNGKRISEFIFEIMFA